MGTALILVGFAVQVAGVIIAAAGVWQTRASLFPGRLLPPERWWRWVRARPPVRWVLGPPEVQALAGTAAGTVTVHGSLRGRVTRGAPAEGADEAAWRSYLLTRLDDLSREVDDLYQQAGQDRIDAEARAGRLSDDLRAAEGRLSARISDAVGGPDGSALDRQFWGLTLTVAGGAIAVVGGLL